MDTAPQMTPDDVDDALFGETDKQGLIIARPISIRVIWADIKQPRRIFPATVRGDWQGSAAKVPEMLRQWHAHAVTAIDDEIDARQLVLGAPSTIEMTGIAIVDDYLSLCQLAACIAHEGLTNPITIRARANPMMQFVPITVQAGISGIYIIETGERRWLAHHLLTMYGDNRFEKIAAQVVKFDIFRQSSENSARQSLNAVGKARQLALILMHLHSHKHKFEDWVVCVAPGECDLNYYAQVAKGDQWGIPRGSSARVLAATGIANRQMVSRYRDILNLPDDVWQLADEENWSEKRCRDALDAIRSSKTTEQEKEQAWIAAMAEEAHRQREQENIDDDMLPVDDIDAKSMEFALGDVVMSPCGTALIIRKLDPKGYYWVKYDAGGGGQYFPGELELLPAKPSDVIHEDDESVRDAEERDYYVPETFEDAQSILGKLHPDLGRLLSVLADYYDHDDGADTDVGWSLEDMLVMDGQLRNELKTSPEQIEEIRNDAQSAKKNIRLYLERVSRHIDNWADNLIKRAQQHHSDLWGGDDV